ncbi:ATP-binding cassette domain-containing protein [Vibrio sp. S9_S30]|nr:ATP-binding cassette domain-containing protein [Vibrio sp. S9_S30]
MRQVDALSGDQKQRVWIAMVLTQKTPIVLLDEPQALIDAALVKHVFGLDSVIIDDPVSYTPLIVPLGK